MRKLTSSDLRELKLLKHYRIIRKWVCKTCDLNDADLELLLYLEADNRRWNKLLKKGWIVVWRRRNRTTQKYNIYKVSFKCKQLISRMYRIMLGEEEIPTKKRSNKVMRGESYSDKVLATSILNMNKKQKF
jgi:hypothetical protein